MGQYLYDTSDRGECSEGVPVSALWLFCCWYVAYVSLAGNARPALVDLSLSDAKNDIEWADRHSALYTVVIWCTLS